MSVQLLPSVVAAFEKAVPDRKLRARLYDEFATTCGSSCTRQQAEVIIQQILSSYVRKPESSPSAAVAPAAAKTTQSAIPSTKHLKRQPKVEFPTSVSTEWLHKQQALELHSPVVSVEPPAHKQKVLELHSPVASVEQSAHKLPVCVDGKTQLCYEFHNTGYCSWPGACRFVHQGFWLYTEAGQLWFCEFDEHAGMVYRLPDDCTSVQIQEAWHIIGQESNTQRFWTYKAYFPLLEHVQSTVPPHLLQ